ncbi:sterol desaturase family protein [Sulfurimonas microaerophilic]|uniref:sterol desaturase family protein n=1 Tax=Sulfurimonas microaerophilic TaxID=3058392 RepID=UPI002714E5E1|nr:sterol desaturase family protein [Sulfurimonas sp. hsl 1-7]
MEYLGVEYFFSASQRIYWLYLLSALLIAVIYTRFNPEIKNYFTKGVLLHHSAKLDYGYFVVVSAIKIGLILPFILSSKDISLQTVFLLQEQFGYIRFSVEKLWVVIGYTLSVFLVNDFTRYWLHRFMHESPLLWKFHRVHHSAEVLNPLTFYRVHPVENILFGLRYALGVGAVTGIFIYFFGANIGVVEIAGVNAITFIFGIAGSNLRHSHIPLRYGVLERVVISPFLHQLHHAKKSMNKNYGSVLSIWDQMFKTYYVTQSTSKLVFGADVKHTTVLEVLYEPFVSILNGEKYEKNIA